MAIWPHLCQTMDSYDRSSLGSIPEAVVICMAQLVVLLSGW